MKPLPEQRMNGTCAGGTGAFIDQMAQLLQTDAAGLNELASQATQTYPIASRCGVFAKTELQPLLNEGAARTDLAASVLAAVVTQTIAGLACGRPIRGHVALLGGPLHFMPMLQQAFRDALSGQVASFAAPENAHLYVAMGAAQLADGKPVSLADLVERIQSLSGLESDVGRMPPLFSDEADRTAFYERHAQTVVEIDDIRKADGDCFFGNRRGQHHDQGRSHRQQRTDLLHVLRRQPG